MRNEDVSKRSSMQVALITRLLGITLTIFVLILTIKSELLNYRIITWQLVLSIPILFTALVTSSKMVNLGAFREHKIFALFVNSIAIALIFNTIGLLVTKYVSAIIGTIYFILFVGCYGYFLKKDWKSGKIHNEVIIIILLITLGLIPALFILT